MADKSFGVKELNLLNASGTPTVTSPNNLNLNANTVAISTSCTIGSNLDVDGTTNLDNTDIVGITTIRNASGTKLYEGVANGSKLFHAGTERLSTETYGIDINGTLGADQINCSGVSTITVPANTNPHSSWDVVNNSASSYRFTGPGQDGAEDNPDIYLVRGQRYLFKMNASGHPFQIRVSNGGSAYSDGVTNNGAQTGNVVFNVQHDAPAHLFYQCTSHGSMVGNIYIVGQHLANGANNRVLTATSAYGINAESNMTFDGDDLTISHSGLAVNIFESTDNHSRLRIRSSDASLGQLEFADQTDADAGEIRYDHANDKMTFHVGNNVARVGIDSTGNLGLGTISPDYNLDISNSSGEAQLRIDSSAGNHGMIRFSQAGTNKSYIQHVNGNDLAFGPGGTERFRISSVGTITTPHQFHIEVRRTNDQTGYVANASFGVPMIFNDVITTRGTTNSALNTSTGKITVPVDGVYFLEGSVFTSTGNYFSQAWFTEGTSRMQNSDHTQPNNHNKVQASGMHYLSANTEVGFHPYGSSNTSLTLGDSVYHTWFRVTLIG